MSLQLPAASFDGSSTATARRASYDEVDLCTYFSPMLVGEISFLSPDYGLCAFVIVLRRVL